MKRLILVALITALTASACSSESEPEAVPSTWTIAHTSTHWWMSAYAATATDQWIVGGTTTDGAIVRYDGAEFSDVDHGADIGLLNWVHGFASGELIVVGNGGAVLRGGPGGWTHDDAVTDQNLWGVWGADSTDVWAVGGNAVSGTATVLHDTGDGFAAVPIPDLQRPGVDVFFKVWGSASDDVYIVGQHGAVLHWNGVELEELLVGISDDLIGVWGTGPDRVVLVGGRRNGAMALWDGTAWSNPDLARFPGINGVWLDSDTVYIVGNAGAVGQVDFATGEATIASVETPISIHAITGTADGLTAVGGDFSTGDGGPFLGQVLVTPRDAG
jgi:hypothetical protein